MSTLYKIRVRPEEDPEGIHFTATFSPYNIQIDADNEDDVINAVKEVIISEAVKRKDFGSQKLEDNGEGTQVYLYLDIEREFKIRHADSVRRNISLPEWMDIQLRDLGVDASKLFQTAALEYIQNDMRSKLISTVDDLINTVPQRILDEYMLTKLRGNSK